MPRAECPAPGCKFYAESNDEKTTVKAAQDHMTGAHGKSVEAEEVKKMLAPEKAARE